ncbi:MFS transporter [Microvirga sp. 0TCS3.31]
MLERLRSRAHPDPTTSTTGTTSTAASPWRALRHGSMRLWTAANLMSNAGTWMQMVAQNLLVLQLTGSAAMTGLSLSAQAAPGLVLGVVGGTLADRFPRRLVAGLGQLGLALIAFATALLAAYDLLDVWSLMVMGVLSGAVATADGPASSLLGNELVPRRDISSAIAVGSLASNIGRLLGTALAGLTIATAGISAAYVANGLSFLAVAAVIPFLRTARSRGLEPAELAPSPLVSETPEPQRAVRLGGLRFLTGERALVLLVVGGAVTSLLGRNYTMSMAALVTGPLQGSAAAYGQVGTALAVGGIAGGLLAGRLASPRLGILMVLAATAAALQVVVGLAPALLMVMVVAVLMSGAEGAMAIGAQTMLQTSPPDHLRGQVLGAWRTTSTAWGLAGPPVLGLLLEVLGVRTGLVLGGVVTVLLVMAFHVALRNRPAAVVPA